MELSDAAAAELREMASSSALCDDMRVVAGRRHNPFVAADGLVAIDAYLEFVTQFNAFINHETRPFRPITGDFRL